MPVTFIGDVHGWSDRLERVLDQVEGDLVFMGDLIDRGPNSPGVLERVERLCRTGRARCLLGNHEYTLLRAIGYPGTGYGRDYRLFDAWIRSFGGHAVMTAYGVHTMDDLINAISPHLPWLAELPWVLEGDEGDRHWVAVHAGLGDHSYAAQIQMLKNGWQHDDGSADHLFNKAWAQCVPEDLPSHWCVVSGHTPLLNPLVTTNRVLCDTSGGLPNKSLSAVSWPSGRVVRS